MSQPEKSFRIGSVSASVFVNTGQTEGNEPRAFRTVSLQRRYRAGNEWKTTTTFTLSDLPAAVRVLDMALGYLADMESSG